MPDTVLNISHFISFNPDNNNPYLIRVLATHFSG